MIMINKDYFLFPNKHSKCYWKTSNGSFIPVSEMTTGHIENVLKCIDRVGKSIIKFPRCGKGRESWKKIFQNELKQRNVL